MGKGQGAHARQVPVQPSVAHVSACAPRVASRLDAGAQRAVHAAAGVGARLGPVSGQLALTAEHRCGCGRDVVGAEQPHHARRVSHCQQDAAARVRGAEGRAEQVLTGRWLHRVHSVRAAAEEVGHAAACGHRREGRAAEGREAGRGRAAAAVTVTVTLALGAVLGHGQRGAEADLVDQHLHRRSDGAVGPGPVLGGSLRHGNGHQLPVRLGSAAVLGAGEEDGVARRVGAQVGNGSAHADAALHLGALDVPRGHCGAGGSGRAGTAAGARAPRSHVSVRPRRRASARQPRTVAVGIAHMELVRRGFAPGGDGGDAGAGTQRRRHRLHHLPCLHRHNEHLAPARGAQVPAASV